MSDQEPEEVYLSDDQDCDENRPIETRGVINYDDIPVISDQQSLWHQNEPTSSSFCMEEAHEAARYSNILDDLTRFEVPSPLLQEEDAGEIPCSEDIILKALEGQSSVNKRKHASDFLEMQTKKRDLQENGVKEDSYTTDQSKQQKGTHCAKVHNQNEGLQEDGVKEDSDASDQCKQPKRTHSAEVHNQNEKIRRQKLKEKMKILQELIPNCNKRDKSSTLDDAIKYIKTLQYQVQMMSIRAGYSSLHSPLMMMPQPEKKAIQIPSTTLPSFRQTGPPQGGNTGGMEYRIGMGMSGMFSSLNFPMSQVGLPDPYFLPSLAASRLPAPGGIQNPGNFLEPPSNVTSSSMDWTPSYATSSGLHLTTQGVTSPSSQGPISKQSCTRRESTARVLPSKVVLPRRTKEVMDCGSSRSTSSEWSNNSTAQ